MERLRQQKRIELLQKAAAAGLIFVTLLINVKNIFTSCQVDTEYQVTMAYRLLQGDQMFSQMWESHQTSAFFLTFFEWIYLKVTGTTTGIVIYANAVGIGCRSLVSVLVFCTLRKRVDRRAAFAALLLLLNLYPKDVMLPDFANQQIWFALLTMCCLIQFFENQNRPWWLVLGALSLCLEVLSYPGCVLVWLPCVILIGKYSAQKARNIGIFTGVCALAGGAWLLYFMRGEPAKFVWYLYEIWSGDESHAVGLGVRLSLIGEDVLALLQDMKYFLAVAVIALLLALISERICGRGFRRTSTAESDRTFAGRRICGRFFQKAGATEAKAAYFRSFFSWFMGLYILAYLVHLPREQADTKYHFFALYFFVEIAAFVCMRFLNEREKRIFLTGQLVGFGGFIATLLMSDSGLFTSTPYMIPNICVSVIPLMKAWAQKETIQDHEIMRERETVERLKIAGRHGTVEEHETTEQPGTVLPRKPMRGLCVPVVLFCLVMMFRNGIYLNGWMSVPTSFIEDSIFGVDWTAKSGPLKGIVNRGGTYIADISYAEWQQYVQPGDKVLVISYPTLTATVYLYQDVEICVDSVISTPTWSERLLTYWEENPDKYPDVVVVSCYGGAELNGGDNPVTEWLAEEFDADQIVDGQFWRFYLKNSSEE